MELVSSGGHSQGHQEKFGGLGHIQVEVGPLSHIDCASHNQHAKHANARGSGGMPLQENFEK